MGLDCGTWERVIMKGNRLHECPVCHKYFQSLGIARHRTMHYEERMRQQEKERENERPENRDVGTPDNY
jgi:hypothetical protein